MGISSSSAFFSATMQVHHLLSDPFGDDMSSVDNSANLDRVHVDKAGASPRTNGVKGSQVGLDKADVTTRTNEGVEGEHKDERSRGVAQTRAAKNGVKVRPAGSRV
jgi:hypothetical protein